MFKKILAVVLGLVLCLGMTMMVGCGDSAFSGNYVEADSNTITTFSESVQQAEDEGASQKVDFNAGVRAKVYMETEGMKLTSDYTMALVDDTFKLAGNLDMQMEMDYGGVASKNITKGKFWYADSYMFMDANATSVLGDNSTTVALKGKMPMDIEEVLLTYGGGEQLETLPLAEYVQYVESEHVKFYIDNESENKKVKIVFDNLVEDGDQIDGTIIFVYDVDFNLIATSMDLTTTITYGGETETFITRISVEPFDGAINVPADAMTWTTIPTYM